MSLAASMAMFGGGAGGGDSDSGTPSPRRKKLKAVDCIAKIAANDPEISVCGDLASSTVFAMKSNDYTEKLCAALELNTHLTDLDLTDCGITDANAVVLAQALATNSSLVRLNLNKNKIKDEGCSAIANALASNSTLREIELFGMQGGGKWGEGCLSTWLEMYKRNITLLRINWTTSSKQTVTLTKMLARNTDINKRIGNGEDPAQFLPAALKDNPPTITFYKVPDVKSKRGGVADKESPGRRVGTGQVMRNGVADVAAAPGSVAARLAAMRAGNASSGLGAAAAAPTSSAPQPEPAPQPAPAPVDTGVAEEVAPGTVFTCLLKSQIRTGFDMASDKCGILAKGEEVAPLEIRRNTAGTRRVRFAKGWVSAATGDGRVVLQLVEPAPSPAPVPAPSPVQSPSVRSPPSRPAPKPAPDPEDEVATGTKFACLLKSQIRAGFEMDSDKVSVLSKGTVVEALEARRNIKGTLRVRFDLGWVSESTSDGRLVLQPLNSDDTADADAAAAAAAAAAKQQKEAEAAKQAAAEQALREKQAAAARQQEEEQAAAASAAAAAAAEEQARAAKLQAAQQEQAQAQAQASPAVSDLKEEGLRYFERHEFEASIATLTRAATEQPADAEISEALAFAKLTLERQREAERERQCVALMEEAMVHFSSRRFDECVEVLERALKIQPHNTEIQEALAFAEGQMAME